MLFSAVMAPTAIGFRSGCCDGTYFAIALCRGGCRDGTDAIGCCDSTYASTFCRHPLPCTLPCQESQLFGLQSDKDLMQVIQDLSSSGVQTDKDDLQRIERSMAQARTLVNTYVSLAPETLEDNELREALAQSAAGSANASAENKSHVVIFYSQANAGEATAQPHLRIPGLRNRGKHMARFLSLCQTRRDASGELEAGDIYILNDCGKEGNHSKLLGSFHYTPEADEQGRLQKALPIKNKHCRQWMVCMSESSVCEKLNKVRGFASVNQVSRLHLVSKSVLSLNEHQRLYTPSATNRGNLLGPFVAEPEASEKVWSLQVKDKLVLLGKHGARIPVGGTADGDAEDEDEDMPDGDAEPLNLNAKFRPRDKNDVEPFLFHAEPVQVLEEILHGLDAVAVISLAGDGRLAELCVEKRIPFFGLAFTEDHARALQLRLEKRVFKLMQDDKSRLYSANLKTILSKNLGEVEEKQPEKKPKRKPRQKKVKAEKDTAADEQDPDEDENEDQEVQPSQPSKPKSKPKAKASGNDAIMAELQQLAQGSLKG